MPNTTVFFKNYAYNPKKRTSLPTYPDHQHVITIYKDLTNPHFKHLSPLYTYYKTSLSQSRWLDATVSSGIYVSHAHGLVRYRALVGCLGHVGGLRWVGPILRQIYIPGRLRLWYWRLIRQLLCSIIIILWNWFLLRFN